MRVLQLIDTLEAGGAERVAVNIANTLSEHIEKSYLCATRKEGLLKEKLISNVGYLFLEKKKTIDFSAISALNRFIIDERITILHAHSSSFFLATLMKIMNNKLKIIWHDHYGDSEYLKNRKSTILKLCSAYFDQVLSVNKQLKDWSQKILKHKRVYYLPNFTLKNEIQGQTKLNGFKNKRIVHLANLRPQKDHSTLIKSFAKVVETNPDWTLHCIGQDFNDEYSLSIKNEVKNLNLSNSIFFYGSIPDVANVLNQCDFGVLSSKSEGLPMAILEYGMPTLAVIATDVGECSTVIENNVNGLIVPPENSNKLAQAIIKYIREELERNRHGVLFNKHITKFYSEKVAIDTILKIYKNNLDN